MTAVDYLAAHGLLLALGASLLLAAGCAATLLWRAPIERRRLGVVTSVGLLAYLAVALVPLPRWSWPRLHTEPAATPALAMLPPPLHRSAPLPAAPLPHDAANARPATAPAALAAPPAAGLAIDQLLATVFLAGAVAVALWLLCGYGRLRRLLRQSRPAPAWLSQGAGVPVRVTDRAARPFCTGALWPVVVLPRDLAVPARAATARAVLAHELAHVRAGDCRAQLLLALLLPLLFWQPLFWWLRAQVRFCSELLADDRAAQQLSASGYARELLEVVAAGHARMAPAGALSIFHRPSEFYRRIQMLLGREVALSHVVSLRHRFASAASVLTMVAVTAGFCGVARAQEPENAGALRAEAAQLRQMVRELKAEVGKLQQRLQVQGTPVEFRRFDAAADPAAEPAADPVADPAEAKAAGVPVLQEIPLIAHFFQNQRRDYTVRDGDSLQSIARRELGTAAAASSIVECNPGLDPRRLRPGQKLALPVAPGTDPVAAPPAQGGAADPFSSQPIAPEVADAAAPMGHGGHSIADRSLSDLLNVVTRCIELRGDVEIAEAERARLSQLVEQNLSDRQSLQVATIKLRTLVQQRNVAEQLLRGELAGAQAELQRLQQMQQAGLLPAGDGRIAPVENFVKVLLGAF